MLKGWLTYIGAAIVGIALTLQEFGVQVDVDGLRTVVGALSSNVTELIGLVTVVIGRMRASTPGIIAKLTSPIK